MRGTILLLTICEGCILSIWCHQVIRCAGVQRVWCCVCVCAHMRARGDFFTAQRQLSDMKARLYLL